MPQRRNRQIPPLPPGSALPAVQPPGRPAIGIALEGGGALGLAHIGVLQWFEEHHIPVDRISGTSMGSLVGALYATGTHPPKCAPWPSATHSQRLHPANSLCRLQLPPPPGPPRNSRCAHRRSAPRPVPPQRPPHRPRRQRIPHQQPPRHNSQELDYNRLPIPFRCVATELNTLHPSPLPRALCPRPFAPLSPFPASFRRFRTAGHYLVDGGILDNLPTGRSRATCTPTSS